MLRGLIERGCVRYWDAVLLRHVAVPCVATVLPWEMVAVVERPGLSNGTELILSVV